MQNGTSSTITPAQPEAQTGPTEVEVRALDYLQLRQLAESSAGVENESVDFFFPEGRVLERAVPGQPLKNTDVLVPAYNQGKYPRNSIGLSPTGDLTHATTPSPAGAADAVFWSDAAVHKFVIPYAASFAGESAREWVSLLQQAWNYYQKDNQKGREKVTVYALVHMTAVQTRRELDPALSLLVAYVVGDGTELLYDTIPDFLDKHPPLPPYKPEHPKVKYWRGDSSVGSQRPDYVQLRAMAEWAASLRNEHAYFVFRAGAQGFERPTSTLPDVGPGDIVVPTCSPSVPADRPSLKGLFFQGQGQHEPWNLAEGADAVFWSSGSIEQFLIPYYASKGGLSSLRNLADMVQVWETTQPGARDGDSEAAEVLNADDEVFGLVHLPSSEWTEVHSALDPATQLRLVTPDRRGGPRLRPLHHFTGRR